MCRAPVHSYSAVDLERSAAAARTRTAGPRPDAFFFSFFFFLVCDVFSLFDSGAELFVLFDFH